MKAQNPLVNALEGRETFGGSDHPTTAITLIELADVLGDLGIMTKQSRTRLERSRFGDVAWG